MSEDRISTGENLIDGHPTSDTSEPLTDEEVARDELHLLQKEQAKRIMARRYFRWYLYYVHGPTWVKTRMSDYLADRVQEFVETETGNAYDILIIQTPPQHGKSITITESFPSWYLGRFPKHRIIEASYNDDTAKRFGRKNLDKVEQYGPVVFGQQKGSIWTTTEFELANGWGRMISRGIMSGITGNPANLLIIDDPIKNREEADSETYREKLWNEWFSTLKTRLAAGAKVIIIATPWHEDDLMSRIKQYEPYVTVLRLPIEAEENDPLGRPVGAALAPELGKDDTWLHQFKAGYLNDPKQGGLRAWQALYQCAPRVEGGNLVKREWWKRYDRKDITAFATTVISVDAAFKDSEANDFVAIEVWSKLGSNYYLRYAVNQHLNFPATVQMIVTIKQLYPESQYILIEDKANGSAVIQTLRSRFIGVIAVNPKGGKTSRVNAVSPAIESGNVFLPYGEPWAQMLEDQFAAFPAGKHDDMCFAAGTLIATARGDIPIEQVTTRDRVWTPFGLRRVLWAGQTGVSEVVTRCGLTGTPDHPVYQDPGIYNSLKRLTGRIHCDILSLKGVITWKYRNLLNSMASPTDSWEQESIISVSRIPMPAGGVLRDCTSRFGSIIRAGKFRKGMKFIIRTATLLTTTTATWSVYRVRTIMRSMWQRIMCERIWTRSDLSQRTGTGAKKDERGIGITRRVHSCHARQKSACVSNVGRPSSQKITHTPGSVRITALLSGITTTESRKFSGSVSIAVNRLWRWLLRGTAQPERVPRVVGQSSGPRNIRAGKTMGKSSTRYARCVGKSSTPNEQETLLTEQYAAVTVAQPSCDGPSGTSENGKKVPVYNLTVQGCHLYYAGGILVHNCDACSQALSFLIFSNGLAELDMSPQDRYNEAVLAQEQRTLTSAEIYDVYGSPGF